MTRRVLSLLAVLTFVVGLGISVADQFQPAAPNATATALVPRGNHPCFGVGTEGCCKEIATLGIVGALTGNEIAAAVAGLYYIWAC